MGWRTLAQAVRRHTKARDSPRPVLDQLQDERPARADVGTAWEKVPTNQSLQDRRLPRGLRSHHRDLGQVEREVELGLRRGRLGYKR